MNLQYFLSQVFITINFIFLIMSYQSKKRKNIILCNFGSLISTGISYVFLSAYSGLAMVFISIIRNIIFIIDENKNGKSEKYTTKDYIILAFLLIAVIISGIYTYNGILSMTSVVGAIIFNYSVWQKNTKVYKALGIPNAIIWLIYNIYIFSIMGIIFEIILIVSSIIGYLREDNKKDSEKNSI